jgi:hypothetical protein
MMDNMRIAVLRYRQRDVTCQGVLSLLVVVVVVVVLLVAVLVVMVVMAVER